MSKSHVGMGYTVCPVCLTEHDEVVLLDMRLKNSLEQRQATGWGMCPDCADKKAEGYIALIGAANEPRSLNDAVRTGDIVHIRSSVWPDIFNTPTPDKGIAFVPTEVIDHLKGISNESTPL